MNAAGPTSVWRTDPILIGRRVAGLEAFGVPSYPNLGGTNELGVRSLVLPLSGAIIRMPCVFGQTPVTALKDELGLSDIASFLQYYTDI